METALFTANNIWMMLCTGLVFFMHLGFSFLEIGLTRQKNTINILFKNIFIITVGLLLYYVGGFNLMYPGFEDGDLGFLKFAGFGIDAPEGGMTPAYADGGYTWWTDFLFQGMFAATAATIVSGAVAERIKLQSFFLFTIIYVGVIYPIAGSWQWGGGFLSTLSYGEAEGFYDFAGSTIVHSVGGWAALIAVYLLGPRIGKYNEDGSANAITGHSMPFTTAGVLILWLGWFGFNGGSVLSADPELTSLTLVTTSLAAAAGGVSAFIIAYLRFKNLDLTMFLNGILGGLVSITAGADQMSPDQAILIGIIGGALIVFAVSLLDKLKLDDPVGAIAVHLGTGIWGTLAVGIFGAKASLDQLLVQLAGAGSVALFCSASAFLIIFTLKKTMGIRVSREEEIEGLDIHEHGMDAYPDFRLNQH
jgi:ammonium transporter, Amt family